MCDVNGLWFVSMGLIVTHVWQELSKWEVQIIIVAEGDSGMCSCLFSRVAASPPLSGVV